MTFKNDVLAFLTLERWITFSNATTFIKQTFLYDEVDFFIFFGFIRRNRNHIIAFAILYDILTAICI